MKKAPADVFKDQLAQYRLPPAIYEHRFALLVNRQHRWDVCWTQFMVAVEIQGFRIEGVRLPNGAHRQCVTVGHFTPSQIPKDLDKLNMGNLLGWHVLWFAENHVTAGDAIRMTMRVLASRGWEGPT